MLKMKLYWPIIIPTTVILYALIILTLPFNPVFASVMLFSLIGFWSRMPGVGIYDPTIIIYMTDFLDIFIIILAVNLGIFPALAFCVFWNLYSKLCGPYAGWIEVMKDTGSQAIIVFLLPLIHAMSGGNLVITAAVFTILRNIFFFLVSFVITTRSIMQEFIMSVYLSIALIFINSFYAKLFGNFFYSLMQKGASFSWPLFLIATIVILLFTVFFMGFSPADASKKAAKNIVKASKKHKKRIEQKKQEQKPRSTEDVDFMNDLKRNI